jgi:Esterase-like activity of phytase
MAKRSNGFRRSNGSLPREFSLRSPNQGMEGLTITPDDSTLVGIMQSALKTPGLEGSAKPVPLARIVTVNLATKAVKEYLYPLANPAETKVAVSEITALSNTLFLVDERDGELQPRGNKKVYIADIADATDVGPGANVPGGVYRADAGGLQLDGKPVETLVGVSSDVAAVDKLRSLGVTVASKPLKLDLGALLTELNDGGRILRTRQDRRPRHPGRRQDARRRQRQRLRAGRHRVADTAVQAQAEGAGQWAPGYGRVPGCRHHQTAAADPAADGIRQGRLTSPRVCGKCRLSAGCRAQTRTLAEGVVAWSGDTTS